MNIHEIFLKKLKDKNHSYRNREFEVVGKYKNTRTKILCENEYGKCSILPKNLYKGIKPSITSAINKTEYFINQSKEIHGDKYDYSKVEYINSYTKVKIICPEHGEFEQKPTNHLQGYSCNKCGNELSNLKLKNWCEVCNNKNAIFYILRCWNETEEFFKVGITCRSVSSRYPPHRMPYNYEIMNYIESEDREYIWNLEKEWINKMKNYKYKPQIKFSGITECFKIK